MALIAIHNETQFGVGDVIRVHQRIMEGDKNEGKGRVQIFEGMVIKIKGRDTSRSFTVRKIGAQKIGVEQIYPLVSPLVEKIEVVRKGTAGVRRAKLYYTRDKSKRDIETIYSRAHTREENRKKSK